jgi:hypothetical protein
MAGNGLFQAPFPHIVSQHSTTGTLSSKEINKGRREKRGRGEEIGRGRKANLSSI